MPLLSVSLLLALADPRAYAGPEAVPSDGVPQDMPAQTGPSAQVPEDMSEAPAPPPREESPPPPRPAPRRGDPLSEAVREVRVIEVTTDLLGKSTRMDVQRHAGGRAIVDAQEGKEQGASGVGELLDKVPGVRAVEGRSGLGTSATKLNLAVRGADPRLSEQATVMLDEVPIAPAPYGQPALSLFPLSLFQIARVDTVRGGSSVRFGPWTSGGVFNLVSHPIPKNPTISVFGQTDQFGDAGLAGSYGGTHRGLGMYFEYAPRFGRTYREHSDFQSHGGIVKFHYDFSRRVSLTSSTHVFWERAELPGGLANGDQANLGRFGSKRPFDFFDGHREATSLKLRWEPRAEHELGVIAFYSHTLRRAVMATNEDRNLAADPTYLSNQPRVFDVVGVEPRYALRVRHRAGFQDLSFGARGVFEQARLREFRVDFPARPGDPLVDAGDARVCPTGTGAWALRCLDGRTGGYSLYAEDKLYLLDTKLVITAGVRMELMRQSFADVLTDLSLPRPFQGGFLPALSVWYGNDNVAGFVGYGRSFGAPSYYSGTIVMIDPNSQGRAARFIKPELADTVEGGIKLMELGGVYAEATGWYKHYNNLRDEGDNGLDVIVAAHAYGAELDVDWEPGEVWEKVEGLTFNAGYAWTGSRLLTDMNRGNRLPWYPMHEAWGAASYEAPFGLKLGTKVDFTGKQFTDLANSPFGFRATEEIGEMKAYTLMSAFTSFRSALPQGWRVEVTVGVKNLLDQQWFTRTDDINGGLLPMRPRTFYLSLGFAHEWIRGKAGEQARARYKRGKLDRRRFMAGERRTMRWLHRTFGGWL